MKRWISKKEEELLFRNWHKIYEEIRNKKISSRIIRKSIEKSTDLHKENVIEAILKDHSKEKEIILKL